ncbi:MAG: RNase adapter RapZ [Desulfatirhabdiaceae bacterium]
MKRLNLTVITGLSGSGKSTAIAAFEDAGYYCVDNMPVRLLPKFLELPIESDISAAGLAFVMDIREKNFLTYYEEVFDDIRRQGYSFQIIFLEADESVLLQRYSQTRRQHPLTSGKSLTENIQIEQKQLQNLRNAADQIIDSTHLSVHELKSLIMDIARKNSRTQSIQIAVMSFGFKYGIPREADLIMDVRFLSNPFFIKGLKALDGRHEKVSTYVLNQPQAIVFIQMYSELLEYLIPLYEKEGKSYLTIAIGCTGGRHRSVVIANMMFNRIQNAFPEKNLQVTHRDIEQA